VWGWKWGIRGEGLLLHSNQSFKTTHFTEKGLDATGGTLPGVGEYDPSQATPREGAAH